MKKRKKSQSRKSKTKHKHHHDDDKSKSPAHKGAGKRMATRKTDVADASDSEGSPWGSPAGKEVELSEEERVEKGKKGKGKGRKKGQRSKVSLWCHQCKQKHNDVVYCTRDCTKKYCLRCIQRHYQQKIEEIDEIDKHKWVCYFCQGICTCAFCRRKRALETNTKFESHRGKKRNLLPLPVSPPPTEPNNPPSPVADPIEKDEDKEEEKEEEKEEKEEEEKEEETPSEHEPETEPFICARIKKRDREGNVLYLVRFDSDKAEWVPDTQLANIPGTDHSINTFNKSLKFRFPWSVIPRNVLSDEGQTLLDPTQLDLDTETQTDEQMDDDYKIETDEEIETSPPKFKVKRHEGAGKSCVSKYKTDKDRRITLKHLMEEKLLKPGDLLYFRDTHAPATLLADGNIQWESFQYTSLSTFAKNIAKNLDIDSSKNPYNGWRVVFCRGKVMDFYRQEYLNKGTKRDSLDKKQSEEEEDEEEEEEEDEPDHGEEVLEEEVNKQISTQITRNIDQFEFKAPESIKEFSETEEDERDWNDGDNEEEKNNIKEKDPINQCMERINFEEKEGNQDFNGELSPLAPVISVKNDCNQFPVPPPIYLLPSSNFKPPVPIKKESPTFELVEAEETTCIPKLTPLLPKIKTNDPNYKLIEYHPEFIPDDNNPFFDIGDDFLLGSLKNADPVNANFEEGWMDF